MQSILLKWRELLIFPKFTGMLVHMDHHEIMCTELDSMGIDSTWFQSYLGNRTQLDEVNGFPSNKCSKTCGVPQGSLLEPLLFLIYSNDMKSAVDCKRLVCFTPMTAYFWFPIKTLKLWAIVLIG